ETGVQNSPLCFALLVTAFPGESQLGLLKLPLLYALFVLISASVVTGLYRLRDARNGRVDAAGVLGQGAA
ncbi:MAG: hypothetical protein RL385_1258, partial [Pseudomonadota bacterium]